MHGEPYPSRDGNTIQGFYGKSWHKNPAWNPEKLRFHAGFLLDNWIQVIASFPAFREAQIAYFVYLTIEDRYDSNTEDVCYENR